VPKNPVTLRLKVRSGDSIAATVTVAGQRVRLALRDLTTRASYLSTQRASAIDVSSAEWIAEAPSVCYGQSNCRVLPLADFGSVAFSASSATSTDGHKGPIGDSAWSLSALELLDLSGGFGPARFRRAATVATATPTSLTPTGSAFSVAWQQAPAPSGAPVPVGPFGG
jgi:Peptidase A4 family